MSDLTFVILDETTSMRPGDDDDLEHIFCDCNENVALCGTDLTDVPEHDWGQVPDEDVCVVCLDLEVVQCARCGA